MADYKNVMIYVETDGEELATITKELLGGGRTLADELGEELHALVMGDHVAQLANDIIAFGADRVYTLENPVLSLYQPDLFVAAMSEVIDEVKPRILLFGHTDMGADLGPRLSFRINRTVATDCVDLAIQPDTKSLLQTKPVYGGLAMATYISEGFPQMATVRPKSLTPAEQNDSAEGSVVSLEVGLEGVTSRINILERVTEEVEGIKLEDADVIVSGGRGIGSEEGFKELEKTTHVLKGAMGASRAAIDNEWVPTTLQVGITGKIVAPNVYLAVAISGASQHMTGCSKSKTIVAINNDPAAPIFKEAHFGVVGDWKVVLPAFVAKLKALE